MIPKQYLGQISIAAVMLIGGLWVIYGLFGVYGVIGGLIIFGLMFLFILKFMLGSWKGVKSFIFNKYDDKGVLKE